MKQHTASALSSLLLRVFVLALGVTFAVDALEYVHVIELGPEDEWLQWSHILPNKAIRRVLQRPGVDDVGELKVVVVLAQNIC